MDIHRRSWRRAIMFMLVLSLGLFGAPLPTRAGDVAPSPPPTKTPLAKSVQKIVATTPLELARTPAMKAQQAPQPTSVDLASPSFFKTPAGIVVIGVFAAGTAYALYSMSNDRIRGSGR